MATVAASQYSCSKHLWSLGFVVFNLRISGHGLQLGTFLSLKSFLHAHSRCLITLNNGKQQGTDRLMLHPLQQMRSKHLDPNALKGQVSIKETFCLSTEFASDLKIFIKFVATVHLGFRE